jgi:hypothetical protein
MRTDRIYFPKQKTPCVFPDERSNLEQAISELDLKGRYPVIVLIGAEIDEQQIDATRHAIQNISRIAEEMKAIVIGGGTNLGVMAEIGQIRSEKGYKFPLIGVAPEELVTWPGGPRNTRFLWWGKQRWQLESHYSHFILVPGSNFGDESPWIVDVTTLLSKDHKSVTILMNGGEVSRKDIELSLDMGRPVIALSRTGGLADELARQPNRNELITVIPSNAEQRIAEAVQAALSVHEKKPVTPNVDQEQANSIKQLITLPGG